MLLDQSLDSLKREYLQHRCDRASLPKRSRRSFDLPGDSQHDAGRSVSTAGRRRRATLTSLDQRDRGSCCERLKVRDLVIENPPLEEIVKAIYRRPQSHGVAHVAHVTAALLQLSFVLGWRTAAADAPRRSVV